MADCPLPRAATASRLGTPARSASIARRRATVTPSRLLVIAMPLLALVRRPRRRLPWPVAARGGGWVVHAPLRSCCLQLWAYPDQGRERVDPPPVANLVD